MPFRYRLRVVLRAAAVVCFALAVGGGAGLAQSAELAPSAAADELLRKGISAQQQGDMRGAIEAYRKALELAPGMADARANLGAALAAAGDYDGAIREDMKALENAPDKTAVRMNLALAYYKKSDWSHAREEFSAVHAARPSDLSAAMLLGYCDVKAGKADEAAAMLGPMENGREANPDFEYVLADALIESGKAAEGLPRMEKSAQATHSIDAWVIAGEARLHRREFREGRADLEEALKIGPDFPGLQTMVGQARDALGDTEGALPAFEAALKQDPRDFTANLYLGTMRLKQRDLEKARPLLEMALQLHPEMPQAEFQTAKLNGMMGKFAEAAATLEGLEKADPNWLDLHIELASIYYKLHRPEDGQRERNIVQQIEAKQQQQGPKPEKSQ